MADVRTPGFLKLFCPVCMCVQVLKTIQYACPPGIKNHSHEIKNHPVCMYVLKTIQYACPPGIKNHSHEIKSK